MRKAIIVFLLYFLAFVVGANDESFSLHYQCSDASHDLFIFEAYTYDVWTFVPQSEVGETVYLENFQGVTTLRFIKPSNGVFLWQGMIQIGVFPSDNISCEGHAETPTFDINLLKQVFLLMRDLRN